MGGKYSYIHNDTFVSEMNEKVTIKWLHTRMVTGCDQSRSPLKPSAVPQCKQGYTSNQATTVSYHVIISSLFTNNPTIRCYIVGDTGSVVK
jgi:hypothetical protein